MLVRYVLIHKQRKIFGMRGNLNQSLMAVMSACLLHVHVRMYIRTYVLLINNCMRASIYVHT